MMKPSQPFPVKCDVCDVCICFCARTYEFVEEPSDEELNELSTDMEEIRKREEYLRSLRQYLESKIQQHAKGRGTRAHRLAGIV